MSFNVHLDQINPLLGQETVEIDGWYNKVWNSHAEVHGAIGTRSLERQFTHAARHGHLMDKNVFQMIEREACADQLDVCGIRLEEADAAFRPDKFGAQAG
ncbi:MAG TPA: hypothetical protein VM715_21780 [Candidatus Acidoferrum sp.]|jgi:hypothetical protein|nr:hypothetical protein [Candidatus Acidoferrum sp.]